MLHHPLVLHHPLDDPLVHRVVGGGLVRFGVLMWISVGPCVHDLYVGFAPDLCVILVLVCNFLSTVQNSRLGSKNLEQIKQVNHVLVRYEVEYTRFAPSKKRKRPKQKSSVGLAVALV